MDSRGSRTRSREEEAERYRHAASLALDQLQWCISYLQGIRKSDIARALARNRTTIIERYRLNR